MRLAERKSALEALLLATQAFWQPSPFREPRPLWCSRYPVLTGSLLALDDTALTAMGEDPALTSAWLLPALPELKPLAALIELATAGEHALREGVAGASPSADAKANRDIPGRKLGQIDAFVAAVGRPQAPLVDWCAGKGHLSRRFLLRWGGEALALERNAALCCAGEDLARRVRHPQRFLVTDVMSDPAAETLRGAHVVALHACGDLHRRLIELAAAVRAPAIDLAPCCYQLTRAEFYRPLATDCGLRLDRNALKLAVTETVTATRREATASARDSAWKLAFLKLRQQLQPDVAYRPFRPVPASWRSADFSGFLQQLAAREGVSLPAGIDLAACEAAGWQRHGESRRLQLVRSVFRRALEVWLLCDLAVWLEKQGYAVSLGEFCARSLTPRNLLLSARAAW